MGEAGVRTKHLGGMGERPGRLPPPGFCVGVQKGVEGRDGCAVACIQNVFNGRFLVVFGELPCLKLEGLGFLGRHLQYLPYEWQLHTGSPAGER